MVVPPALLERYLKDPVAHDDELRAALKLPEDCYYSVSVWPVPGVVTVDKKRSRVVRAKKVSKSDQPT
jgi:hypothetical protein